MVEILIPIPQPEDEDGEIDLPSYFGGLIADEFGELSGDLLLALDLDLEDDRATVDDVTIEDVEVIDDQVFVHYIIEYSAYYGCSDMDYAEQDARSVTGTRRGSDWVFLPHVSPQRLAPNEEL